MYAIIRKYRGREIKEVTRRVNESFVPLIQKQPGFIAYYALESPSDTWASISIFEERSQAEASNNVAKDWVQKNMAQYVSGPPEITAGELVIHELIETIEQG